jgi:acid phosphatase (class A)
VIGRPDSDGIQAIVVSHSSVTAIVGLEHSTAQRMKWSHLVSSGSDTKSIWNRVSTTLARRREMKVITIVLFATTSVVAAWAQTQPLSRENANPTTPGTGNANLMAAAQAGQYAEKRKLKVLTAEQIDASHLLPPPPPDGSHAQIVDLNDWRQVVGERTPERYAQARWDNEHEDISAFAAVLGPKFNLSNLPATAKLIAEVDNDQAIAASDAKVYFHRRFPVASSPLLGDYHVYSCDDDVKKPADRPLRSYPSGHSTMGYTFAVVLAALVPNKAQEIFARAADYAYSRRVCGDHYRSDTEASHALGSALGIMFLASPKLQSEIEATAAELRAAGIATN